jgi:glycosyltransferase involved in cell wall biosynthesis
MKEIKITFIIKALNEETNIAACIESCIREAEPYNSEIILVDSLSTDKTITIAKQYPVKIVQFENIADIGCGAAPQLGYQHAQGKYIYLLDGDMQLCEGFLTKAMQYLDENSQVAGVSGKLVDTQLITSEDRRRASEYSHVNSEKNVTHLGGGGLYRSAAIESVLYFSHSQLTACEELELGSRLVCKGWGLIRMDYDASLHTGHNESDFQRIKRLWKNGRLAANGVLLKSAFAEPWFIVCASHLWFLFMPLLVNLVTLFFLLIASLFINLPTYSFLFSFLGVWLLILLLISIKKKSAKDAAVSVVTWHITFFAALLTIFKKPVKPNLNLKGKII